MPRTFPASPWGGAADGGTNASVVGEALLDLGMPLCRFGHTDVPALAGGVRAPSSELALVRVRVRVLGLGLGLGLGLIGLLGC